VVHGRIHSIGILGCEGPLAQIFDHFLVLYKSC
jgi:hypothetical protein